MLCSCIFQQALYFFPVPEVPNLPVEDTGNGIPEELRERVFDPFFRVDKSRSRELGGVGLGLALVHEIVRVHDGSITVKSSPSGGTIFDVVF